MPPGPHYVIIGNGVAGNHAAATVRAREPKARITIISAGALPFYNRYDLPEVFRGRDSWVEFLVNPPEYYEEQAIGLRRKTTVTEVDSGKRRLTLAHREVMAYDRLLVATGGAGYLPERLLESRHQMHGFSTFRDAMEVRQVLPERGRVIMLGGDTLGLDLARSLLGVGYEVALVAGERTFWPHEIPREEMGPWFAVLREMGMEVHESPAVRVEKGGRGRPARVVTLEDGAALQGDVVMPFYGLSPSVDFMSNSGIDLERGILVDPTLKTTGDDIWAAGDVCQIWSPELNAYRFYYGWRNVKRMGEVAAQNMTGGDAAFSTFVDETLKRDGDGHLYSPFWEHD
jgi:NAD(P)H-nitrite reductase large subunit